MKGHFKMPEPNRLRSSFMISNIDQHLEELIADGWIDESELVTPDYVFEALEYENRQSFEKGEPNKT